MRHGNYLTVQTVDRPIRRCSPNRWSAARRGSSTRRSSSAANICETATEVPKPAGSVPHHLPGTNPFLHEVADGTGCPPRRRAAAPETMYPEYRKRMGKPANPPPARCERYCNCGLDGGGCNSEVATRDATMRELERIWLDRASCRSAVVLPGGGGVRVRHSARNSRRPAIAPRLKCSPSRSSVYMLGGAGGNITVQIGSEGVLLVDTGLAASAPRGDGRDSQAVERADSLHHQHARPSGSRGRQRRVRRG